jgi:hypothetical protein
MLLTANLFLILIIIALIFLFIASVCASIGTVTIASSPATNNFHGQSAWTFLGLATFNGWFTLITAVVLLISAAIWGAFKDLKKFEDTGTMKTIPETGVTVAHISHCGDLALAYRKEEDLTVSQLISTSLIISMIFTIFMVATVGVECISAINQINQIGITDAYSASAHSWALAGGVTAFISVFFMIAALIAYGLYTRNKHHLLDHVKTTIDSYIKSEQQQS